MKQKPLLSFWQIWNMSFGFVGIQFGFALQGGYVSSIFQTLGSSKDDIPLFWIVAPLTGLLVQPIIGYFSDRTWSETFGRRRPYFLIGAILSCLALCLMPNSPTAWFAVGMLCLLDASMNISMEPFRAFVADKLPDEQRTYGFIVQTLIIGVGTWVASQLPLFMQKIGFSDQAAPGIVPDAIKYAFYVGAVVFMSSILWTIFTTKEYPPEDMAAFEREKAQSKGLGHVFSEIFGSIGAMPKIMWQLGIVQFFSWFAFFTMWNFATIALAEHVLGGVEGAANYDGLKIQAGAYMGTYGIVSTVFALLMTLVSSKITINRRLLHLVSLVIGGIGFISMYFIQSPAMIHFSYACIGVAWASILSMPYAMLSSAVPPQKMGIYMGLFNAFICIPQIVAAAGGINFAYKTFFGDDIINTMLLAGTSLIIGGLCTLLVDETTESR
ncbi:MAG TPA: MFS transporter [Chitinophagales bacterium]|nr:MFS transporter [Chitinophagales bacterium]HNL06768.1 MFS transporter [Chitinophagales bacterium]